MRVDLQKDLNATIAHVVGQGVVALSVGCEIHLQVDPHPSWEFFEGHCWVRHPEGDLSDQLRRPLGLAGCVSALAFTRGSPEELEAVEVFDKLEAGEITLSAADAAMAEGFTLADVSFALDVLRARWPAVEEEVGYMAPRIMQDVNHLH